MEGSRSRGIPKEGELRELRAFLIKDAIHLGHLEHPNIHPENPTITKLYKKGLLKPKSMGDREAQKTLANIYQGLDENFKDFPVDEDEALYWVRLCAAQMDAACLSTLADFHDRENHGKRHLRRTVCLYWLAMEQGNNTDAAQNIGICYEHGLGGLLKDKAMANYYYREAAKAKAKLRKPPHPIDHEPKEPKDHKKRVSSQKRSAKGPSREEKPIPNPYDWREPPPYQAD